jgi:hypothetical protein
MAIDKSGVIENVWLGKLPAEKETEILELMRSGV